MTSLNKLFNRYEQMGLVLGGLCHDVGHTGFNNAFEANSFSKLSLRYNDDSILEQHHCSLTFQILSEPENNFLTYNSPKTIKEIRKLVISNILSTDMKRHFELIEKFNSLQQSHADKKEEFGELESDRIILSGIILHCADFNGAAKTFNIAKQWSKKVNMEFSNQYAKEVGLGITPTPYMKDLDKMEIMSKAEYGFLNVIVMPLWSNVNEYFKGALDEVINNLENNKSEWLKIQNELQANADTDPNSKSPQEKNNKINSEESNKEPPKKVIKEFNAESPDDKEKPQEKRAVSEVKGLLLKKFRENKKD